MSLVRRISRISRICGERRRELFEKSSLLHLSQKLLRKKTIDVLQ
jgi:hypothetical protein